MLTLFIGSEGGPSIMLTLFIGSEGGTNNAHIVHWV